MANWLSTLRGLTGIVLMSSCPLCHRAAPDLICHNCQRQLHQCQSLHPDPDWRDPLPLFAWGHYSGIVKRSIAALKYENQPQLAQLLGEWLAQAWLASAHHHSSLIVVPIPMHPKKQQQRGFNQAELLAEAFCRYTRLPLQRQGLVRIRATQAQFTLSPTAREANLADAFAVGTAFQSHPPNQAVLLLDDIYTTGTTARSAAQTLHRQGITVYGIVAIAKTAKDEEDGGRKR